MRSALEKKGVQPALESLLRRYDRLLWEAFAGPRGEEPDLLTLNRLLVAREPFCEFLGALAASPERSALLASRSYAHPNGFSKLVIAASSRFPEVFELRVHAWARPGGDESDIHNHAWDFASTVLYGSLSAAEYSEPVAAGEGARARKLFYCRDDADHFSLEDAGETFYRGARETTIRSGESYFLSHEVLHRVACGSPEGAASCVLQGRERKRASLVLEGGTGKGRRRQAIPAISPESYRSRIEAVARRVARQPWQAGAGSAPPPTDPCPNRRWDP